MSLRRRGERAGNALRTLGGARGRRDVPNPSQIGPPTFFQVHGGHDHFITGIMHPVRPFRTYEKLTSWGAPEGEGRDVPNPSQIGPIWDRFGTDFFPSTRRPWPFISSLESCILCVISNVWKADFIHSMGPCGSIYRCPSQPCLMEENHVSATKRQKTRKCSEDAGRPREKMRHDHFIT
jgi:hypothetical protein